MGLGMWMLYQIANPNTNHKHFGGSAFPLSKWFDPTSIGLNAKTTIYVGFVAVLANLIVAVVITLLCKALRAPDGVDATDPDDYTHEPSTMAPPVPPAQKAGGDELPEPVPAT
jgi:SSS family solute:Na+ symporter